MLIPRDNQSHMRLTAGQEVVSLLLDSGGQLLCAFQVLEDINVGSQECHVLLTASIRHLQQSIQVLQGSAHKVTCTKTPIKIWK